MLRKQGMPERTIFHYDDIKVEVTDINEAHCFKVTIGALDTLMHATAVADLRYKLDEAFFDWMFASSEHIMKELSKK